jgi:hypothetical protein
MDGVSGPGGAGIPYTVVETAHGWLYVVLIPGTGKLFYDPRLLAPTAAAAAAGLRVTLGEAGFRALDSCTPAQLLGAMTAIRDERETG